jgi:hypothetical protein
MFDKQPRTGWPLKVILAFVLMIAASLLGTTLASYVKEVGLFGSGRVGPKYYAFEVDSTSGKNSLTPGESAVYAFTVKNHNSGGVAQVPLKVLIHITYPKTLADTGRVLAELRCGDALLASSDSGTLECAGIELAANTQDIDSYTLTLTWLDADMALLGTLTQNAFDPAAVSIRVSGYQ